MGPLLIACKVFGNINTGTQIHWVFKFVHVTGKKIDAT